MKVKVILLTALIIGYYSGVTQSRSGIFPVELTVEYLDNPSAIDVRQPRFSWKLSPASNNTFGLRQTARRIIVSSSMELIDEGEGDMWNTGWVDSDETQLIAYEGKPLSSDRDYYWKVLVKDEKGATSELSKTARFSTGLFDTNEWTARWIGTKEIFDPSKGDNQMYDPWFRKSFDLKEKPEKAILFVASVGYHEVYVNGKKIGDHVLAPAVTDHVKRARYIAYDIATALQRGNNVIALWLGVSWSIFAPYDTPDKPRTPMVIAQTDIYGKERKRLQRIATDATWKTHPSPNKLLGNWSFRNFGGEIRDMNLDIPDWNKINYNSGKWVNATVYTPSLELSAQMVETNRLFEEIRPVEIKKQGDGNYRVDMGVNFAGWTRIHVKGNPGDTIRFLFSERQQDEMTFGLHSAIVLNQSGEGTFSNRFNYSSGRWITVKGAAATPGKDDITGWMIRTNYKNATTFECSDSLQNWIYNTVNWTYQNLSLGGYVVDCPQRERCGYGGDAHATTETGMLNYQLGALYTKWMQDWRDVQGTESMVGDMNDPNWARKEVGSGRVLGGGVLPHTAPTYWGGGGTAWGGIVVTLPWFIYQYQGDKRVLEENFGMIKKWLAFLDTHVENNLLKRYGGKWDFLGDWLWPGATAQGMNNNSDETVFFNNCYRVYNLKTAAKIARVIGETTDAARWEREAADASDALHRKYYDAADRNYSDHSMRSLAAALYGDIMPAETRPLVMKRLEKEILVNRKGHIDVGITGGAMLFKVLREEGRDDLIYAMTSQTTYPSWGFMKANDATTIWEMWEKDLPGHSLLHSSFLYPGAWYIDGVAGIRQDENGPGYRKFIVRVPRLSEQQMRWTKASYDSPAGIIKSEWKKENGSTELNIAVPPNCTATVYFPAEKNKRISIKSPVVIRKIGDKDGYTLYEVPSGIFRFVNR